MTAALPHGGGTPTDRADRAAQREDEDPAAGTPLPAAGRRLVGRWAWAAAATGGALLFAAFPPLSWWPLGPVGVALLVVSAAGQRLRTATGLGLVFSLVFFGLLVRWLSGNIGMLPWVALTVAESLLLAAMVAPLPLLLRLPCRPLMVAVWWTATESVRSRLPLGGFPWGRLAFSQADSPVLGWARLGGAPAVTLVTALVAGSCASLVLAASPRARVLAAGWLTAAAALSVSVLPPPPSGGGGSAVLAVVQGNVPRERTLAEQARVRNVAQNHAEATRRLAGEVAAGRTPRPDVVLWPENSTDADPRTDPYLSPLVADAVDTIGAPVLVGAILRGADERTYNAGLLWRPRSGPGPWYAKRQLVPFGEYIPARGVLGRFGDLQLIPRDFSPGSRTVVMQAGRVRLSDVVCYEIGYDALVRSGVRAGANLLVEQTNDATFIRDGSIDETEQQLAMARLRAVEHDRAVAVASTTGVSAVIRPDGTVAQRTGLWQRQVLTARVPVRTALTPADRLGVLPEAAVCLLALVALGAAMLGSRGRRGRTSRRGGA